jgi:capsid protein
MKQAVLSGALQAPGFARGGNAKRRQYLAAKWIPQGWQWVDPEKEFKAMLLAIRSGLMSRSEAISAFGYDAEDVDREIAADNQRADDLGLIFDSDPRRTSKDGGSAEPNSQAVRSAQDQNTQTSDQSSDPVTADA